MVIKQPYPPVSRVISTHVNHLHIRVIFGRLYQVRFHFQAVAWRRKTVTQIAATIIINFLNRTLHLGSHHFHKRIRLCLAIGRFQTEKQFFDAWQISHQAFLWNVIDLSQSQIQWIFFRMSLFQWGYISGQNTGIKRRQYTGSHIDKICYFFHFQSVITEVFYSSINFY